MQHLLGVEVLLRLRLRRRRSAARPRRRPHLRPPRRPHVARLRARTREPHCASHHLHTVLTAAYDAGAQFILENPADRSDRDFPYLFLTEKHGAIWRLPELIALGAYAHARAVTFAQCQFGGKYQKYTTSHKKTV